MTITKAVARRKLHALAGTRRSLPGQNQDLEKTLRSDLAEHFEPRHVIEMVWVGDLAYCLASIEVLRAQIAGMKRRHVEVVCEHLKQVARYPDLDDPSSTAARRAADSAERYAARHFTPKPGQSDLDDHGFVALLGRASAEDNHQLRQMQVQLHEEMRERDRIINQIERSRRQAMRDAVEFAAARHRARIEGYTIPELEQSVPENKESIEETPTALVEDSALEAVA